MGAHSQDGCWRYMAVFSAFLIIFVCCGMMYSTPVLVTIFEAEFGRNFTVMEQSALGATLLGSMSLSGLLSLPALRFLSCRGSVIIGGMLAAAGPAAAVFVSKKILYVCLTLGAITGTGVGFAFIPALLSVELHFPHRGNRVATGLALSGIGGGIAAFPPCMNLLVENLKWRTVLLILSAVTLSIMPLGAMLRPPHRKSGRVALTLFKPSVCAQPLFLAVCLAAFVWSFGAAIVYVHLPGYTRFAGYTMEQTAIILSCVGLLSFFSRGVFRVLHLGEAVTMDMVTSAFNGICITAILTGLFPDFSQKYAGLISYAMLFGFYCGFWSNFVNQINVEVVGMEVANAGSGFSILATGLGSLAGPPMAAWLYEETDKYENMFYLSGGCMLFCSLLLMALKLGQAPTAQLRQHLAKKSRQNRLQKMQKEAALAAANGIDAAALNGKQAESLLNNV